MIYDLGVHDPEAWYRDIQRLVYEEIWYSVCRLKERQNVIKMFRVNTL